MHKSSRVVSTRVCPTTTTVCPTTFTTTRPVTAGVTDTVVTGAVPTTTTVPTFTTAPTTAVADLGIAGIAQTGVDLASLLGQFGKGAGAFQVPGITGGVSPLFGVQNPLAQAGANLTTPSAIFNSPTAMLGGVNPFAALAASNPFAALAASSPVLNLFNPALNPQAALLQWNPGAAPTLALTGGVFPTAGKIQGAPAFGKGAGKGLGKAGKGAFGKGAFGKGAPGFGKAGFGKGFPGIGAI